MPHGGDCGEGALANGAGDGFPAGDTRGLVALAVYCAEVEVVGGLVGEDSEPDIATGRTEVGLGMGHIPGHWGAG